MRAVASRALRTVPRAQGHGGPWPHRGREAGSRPGPRGSRYQAKKRVRARPCGVYIRTRFRVSFLARARRTCAIAVHTRALGWRHFTHRARAPVCGLTGSLSHYAHLIAFGWPKQTQSLSKSSRPRLALHTTPSCAGNTRCETPRMPIAAAKIAFSFGRSGRAPARGCTCGRSVCSTTIARTQTDRRGFQELIE